MLPRHLSLLLLGAMAWVGCSPTFNWRAVQLEQAPALSALLPCKPDRGSRATTLLGQTVTFNMIGCETGSTLFAITQVRLAQDAPLALAQIQWQRAMLGNIGAIVSQPMTWAIKGSETSVAPVRLSAQGRRADGSAVAAQAVWFAHQGQLFHAVVYAERLSPALADTFFAGLTLP